MHFDRPNLHLHSIHSIHLHPMHHHHIPQLQLRLQLDSFSSFSPLLLDLFSPFGWCLISNLSRTRQGSQEMKGINVRCTNWLVLASWTKILGFQRAFQPFTVLLAFSISSIAAWGKEMLFAGMSPRLLLIELRLKSISAIRGDCLDLFAGLLSELVDICNRLLLERCILHPQGQ